MNYRVIRNLLGKILMLLAGLMVLPLFVAIIYLEGIRNIIAFLIPIAALAGIGAFLAFFKRAKNTKIGVREGFIIVGIAWILMSLFGCLPFIISGEISDFFTAFFEITSGFTTTGASALKAEELESLSHSMLFWRSFSHWIGGMGILVFILALIPESKDGSAMHILRAESPGPQVGRLVSKMQASSRILYIIYIVLTVIEMLILFALPGDADHERMSFFDSVVISFGTAGTGGFATTSASCAAYAVSAQYVIAIFMIIFGVNFSLYYFLLIKNFKDVYKNEELRWYFAIIVLSVVIITASIYSKYNNFEESFRYAFFQTASIISTTGYSNIDYVAAGWPSITLMVLCFLSLCGSCAGSTAGGMKMSRIIILSKYSKSKIKGLLNPRKVEVISMDGKPIDNNVLDSVVAFSVVYFIVLIVCAFLVSIYNAGFDADPLTCITASLACISNIGPGLGKVGPGGDYSGFSGFSKIVLSLEMIAGRLELFPILVLFMPKTWRKRA